MHFRHHLPLLLLRGWGLVDVAVLITFTALDLAGVKSVPWDPIFLGLITVQGAAVAAWFYLSDHWAGWHAASLLVLIVCLAPCGPQPLWMAGIIVVHLLVVAVVNYPLGMLRDRGWQYRFHPTTPDERKPWQFSLGELVGLMCVVAVGLGLWQLLGVVAPPFAAFARAIQLPLILHLALLLWLPAIRVLAGLVRSRWIGATAVVLGIVHLRLLALYSPPYNLYQQKTLVVVIVVGAAVLVLQAVALRWAGWRIERDPNPRRRLGTERKPLPPEAVDSLHDSSGGEVVGLTTHR